MEELPGSYSTMCWSACTFWYPNPPYQCDTCCQEVPPFVVRNRSTPPAKTTLALPGSTASDMSYHACPRVSSFVMPGSKSKGRARVVQVLPPSVVRKKLSNPPVDELSRKA